MIVKRLAESRLHQVDEVVAIELAFSRGGVPKDMNGGAIPRAVVSAKPDWILAHRSKMPASGHSCR
jgi:hypothetical protein